MARQAAALAGRNILIGTSSWKYAGWQGQLYTQERYLYRGQFAESRFERDCLTEYAEVFKTVSVDAGYYQFPTLRYLEKLRSQVPEDFRFSFKVTEDITVKRFPNLARYGLKAGKVNPHYLNPELFASSFLGPCEAIRQNVGLLMFEFSRFTRTDYAHGRGFVSDLDRFLSQIPAGWEYGVEIRNETFLHPDYFAVLRQHGVVHVMNNWSRMPPVSAQMERREIALSTGFAARFLLSPGRKYEEAVKMFSPYTETKEINLEARGAISKLAELTPTKTSYLFVNNRLEGNSLNTLAGSLETNK